MPRSRSPNDDRLVATRSAAAALLLLGHDAGELRNLLSDFAPPAEIAAIERALSDGTRHARARVLAGLISTAVLDLEAWRLA